MIRTPKEFFAGKEIHYTFKFDDLILKYKTWATKNTNGLYSMSPQHQGNHH
jgi:hypothetical protein